MTFKSPLTEMQTAILEKKLAMSFDDFNHWLTENRITGLDEDDTKDFLAYLGCCFARTIEEINPSMTLDTIFYLIFDDTERSNALN